MVLDLVAARWDLEAMLRDAVPLMAPGPTGARFRRQRLTRLGLSEVRHFVIQALG